MNIRTVSNPIIPIENLKTGEARDVKMEISSEDRDADGRKNQEEPDKSPLNDEEMKRAKEYLENLAGLKTNGLTIEVEYSGDFRIFLIKDQDGRVARRIVEWEMRLLLSDKNKKTGQIFDKSA